jgi:hypothetical protein
LAIDCQRKPRMECGTGRSSGRERDCRFHAGIRLSLLPPPKDDLSNVSSGDDVPKLLCLKAHTAITRRSTYITGLLLCPATDIVPEANPPHSVSGEES